MNIDRVMNEQYSDGLSYAVNGVAIHALEYLAALFDGVNDDGEPGSGQNDCRRDLAASVAPETAIPASAFFNAGASFTPSPVMPTMCLGLKQLYYPEFVFWKYLGKPSAFSMISVASSSGLSIKSDAGPILVPDPPFERSLWLWLRGHL